MRHPSCRRQVLIAASLLTAMSPAIVRGHLHAQPAMRSPAANLQGADSLLSHALARVAEGDTNQALDMLERANRMAPKNTDVLYWRAVIMQRTTFLTIQDMPRNMLAWRLLERAEKLDSKNARYAIEMGRIRLMTPLLRLEAERQFRRALKIAEASNDPASLAEAAYEVGLIKQRRYSTARNRYMVTSPGQMFDPYAATSRLHYVREFLEQHSRPIENVGSVERSEAEELFRTALKAVPTHEPSAIAMLSVLYDGGRYSEMVQVARPFMDAGTGSARIRLSAGLASYRLGLHKDAERLFKEGVERMSALDRADMISLARIVRKAEAASYGALTDSARMHTDSAYWEAADPLLSTPENEAWLEFMARNAFSDLYWTDGDMRQTGWKTDRGMIIARYGEPPQIASFAPQGNADAADAIGRVITVWRWPDQDMHFVFTGPPAMNLATFAGNFRSFAEETRDEVPFSLKNVPIAVNVDSVPMQIARFRGRTANDVTLVIAASTDPSKLYRNAEMSSGTLNWSLRMGQPSRMRLLNSDTMQVRLPAPRTAEQVWIREVKPGNYRIRVEAVDPSIIAAAGRAQDEIDAKVIVPGALMLSDVLLGHKTSAPNGSINGLNDVSLLPRGNLTMQQNEQFTLYWENYGLVPDSSGRVKFDVKIVIRLLEIDRTSSNHVVKLFGSISDAVGISPIGEQALGVNYSREEVLGSRDRVPQVFTLGLGSAPKGKYRLEMTIVDKVTKSTARSDRVFFLDGK
jgi:GWxTD domain-containing protein